MTRKGRCSKRQAKKLRMKWYDGSAVHPRYADLSHREFRVVYSDWPMSLEAL